MITKLNARMDIDPVVLEMAEIIVEGWDPVQIILFGSRARGDHGEDSDVDLLVVMDEVRDYRGLQNDIDQALRCTGMRRDVILTTPADMVRKATVAGTIERAAVLDGRTLHVRGKGDPVIEQTLRWLEYARRDFRGARNQMAAEPPEPSLACGHAQQGAEKSLKAALVFEGIDPPPRTHDLVKLRGLLPADWAIPGTDSNLERISEWAEQSRYFNGWEDLTAADAVWGIGAATDIYRSVVAALKERGVSVE